MKPIAHFFVRALLMAAIALAAPVSAQAPASPVNVIESLQVGQDGGRIVVRVALKSPLTEPPSSFSIANPPRLAFDFAGTENGIGRNAQQINEGELQSANVVQVANRSRVVLNLARTMAYESRQEGKIFSIMLSPPPVSALGGASSLAHFAEDKLKDQPRSIRDIRFRRGKSGEGLVMVDLSDPGVGIDIRTEGTNLVVDFAKATLPEKLRQKLDVLDFATPVSTVSTAPYGEGTRMVISPKGLWEHNAYQSDSQFVIEVKPIIENPNKLVQGSRGGYSGEKLSVNFQNVEVRALLQVIADFTNFNIITSDAVGGNLTLRLNDVPWDQALDIILQAKGLDMRKNGNVIWIAPRDELTVKDRVVLESRQQISDLEPTHTESFQLNYHKAKAIFDLLKSKEQTVLSRRGTVIVDERSNKLFINDTPTRLEDVRRLIQEVDIPVRQVLIEARIVEAQDAFAKNIGVRLGIHDMAGMDIGHPLAGNQNVRYAVGGGLADTGYHTGQITNTPDFFQNSLGVNLPATPRSGTPGQLSFVLFNAAKTEFLNFEISALEADGKGKVISSPRVVTADQVESLIESGTEIPYQQSTSSGATSIAFKKANLSLKVRPQITPDGRVIMSVDVSKDTPSNAVTTGAGIAIDTKHVKTDVLVDNGGTVVIGGIYTQTESESVARIPLLGDLPLLGNLFKQTGRTLDRSELLIFITPKILNDALNLR